MEDLYVANYFYWVEEIPPSYGFIVLQDMTVFQFVCNLFYFFKNISASQLLLQLGFVIFLVPSLKS